MRGLALLTVLLPWACPCRAQEPSAAPSSNVIVQVDSVTVTDLECSARSFELEQTKKAARLYEYIGQNMHSSDWDPRPFMLGTLGCVMLAPVTVLAVPVDLFSAPFRRQCSFRVGVGGTLSGWAGQAVADAPVGAVASNVVDDGVEGVSQPVVLYSSGSAVSDRLGRFSLSFPARMVRSKELSIGWTVRGLPSGGALLRKRGGRFELGEQESEFGTSLKFEETEPRVIVPERRKK